MDRGAVALMPVVDRSSRIYRGTGSILGTGAVPARHVYSLAIDLGLPIGVSDRASHPVRLAERAGGCSYLLGDGVDLSRAGELSVAAPFCPWTRA